MTRRVGFDTSKCLVGRVLDDRMDYQTNEGQESNRDDQGRDREVEVVLWLDGDYETGNGDNRQRTDEQQKKNEILQILEKLLHDCLLP